MTVCPYLQGCSYETWIKGSNYLASQSHAVHAQVQRFETQRLQLKFKCMEKG